MTFVAISSRLKTISLELKDICDQSASCISKFLVINEVRIRLLICPLLIFTSLLKPSSGDVAVQAPEAEFTDNIDINIPGTVESPVFNATTSQPPEFTETQKLKGAIHSSTDISSLKSVVATVILKRKAPQEIKERRETDQPIQSKKKKRKVARNEIDDIFGS